MSISNKLPIIESAKEHKRKTLGVEAKKLAQLRWAPSRQASGASGATGYLLTQRGRPVLLLKKEEGGENR